MVTHHFLGSLKVFRKRDFRQKQKTLSRGCSLERVSQLGKPKSIGATQIDVSNI
jgi:hypothetical protein